MLTRYLRGLPSYLGERLDPRVAPAWVAQAIQQRSTEFLRLLDEGVFRNPRSPYRDLFSWAGLEPEDVRRSVRAEGVEGALRRLFEAGVYVTLEEFKGQSSIERGGRERGVGPADFDNPLTSRHFEGWSGGSGGTPRRSVYDLDFLSEDAVARALFSDAFELEDRTMALWRPAPPDNSALANLLLDAKLGRPFDAWFVQKRHGFGPSGLQQAAFTAATLWAARRGGVPIPRPRYTPIRDAPRVANWLAGQKAAGRRPYLDSLVSCAVRVCLAAEERGLDVAGTFFRVGSEPLTPARAETIARVGGHAAPYYAMMEVGLIGVGCATPEAVDDVHLLTHKLAAVTVSEGEPAPAIYLTTLRRAAPKVMINVESGDVGQIAERACGCSIGASGLSTHAQDVRSHRKFTSEGMNFLAADLQELVDTVLPKRFGGAPTNYQLAEREVGGLPRVEVVVSPRVGHVEETEVRETVLRHLAGLDQGGRLMAGLWDQGETVTVVRREPQATGVGKILALHVAEAREST